MKKHYFLIFLVIIVLFFLIASKFTKPVEILYFYNNKCIVSKTTNKILYDVQQKFGNKVQIKFIEISMFPGDKSDSNETAELREKYKIRGTPVMIINGREYRKAYEMDDVIKEICKNFLLPPLECFIY